MFIFIVRLNFCGFAWERHITTIALLSHRPIVLTDSIHYRTIGLLHNRPNPNAVWSCAEISSWTTWCWTLKVTSKLLTSACARKEFSVTGQQGRFVVHRTTSLQRFVCFLSIYSYLLLSTPTGTDVLGDRKSVPERSEIRARNSDVSSWLRRH